MFLRNLFVGSYILLMLVFLFGASPTHAFHNLPLKVEQITTHAALTQLQNLGFSSLKHRALTEGFKTTSPSTTSPIYGNILPLGIYWTSVYLGVPVMGPFQVALDTGSTDLMVPGFGCHGCVTNVTSAYNPGLSSGDTALTCGTKEVICKGCLFKPATSPCIFINSYETCDLSDPTKSCTIEGPLITDQAGFSDTQSATTQMVLGVIMNQTADFQQLQYIDGIVGFSYPGSSAFGYHSLFLSLFKAGIYTDNIFAMCLTPNSGGILTLGGIDSTLYTGSIPWTPVISTTSFTLTLAGISVGSNSLPVPSAHVIIDSGTNNLLLDQLRFTSVTTAIQNQVCSGNNATAPPGVCSGALFKGDCYAYSTLQIKQFPDIILNLGAGTGLPSVPLTVSPSEYLLAPTSGSSTLCFGLANTGSSFNIIGDVVMQRYYTIFDVANNRIGWPVNTACNPPTF